MAEIPKTPGGVPDFRSPDHPDRTAAGAELERRFREDAPVVGSPEHLAEAATKMPVYYRLPGLFTKTALPADVLDAVEGLWPDVSNYHEKDVLKYLVRAGRKPGVPEARDWLKIVRVAARKYRLLSGEDLPDDV